MGNIHMIELLVEANKKISTIISKTENHSVKNTQEIIDDINHVISQLDAIVETLEKDDPR